MSPERMVSLAKTGQSLPLAVLRQIRGRGAEPRPVAEAAAVLDIEEVCVCVCCTQRNAATLSPSSSSSGFFCLASKKE